MNHELALRTVGFMTSLLLTLAAYFIIQNGEFFNVGRSIIAIVILALIQSLVQLAFFIDVWRGKESVWMVTVFISTVSIIFIIIYFSIWIMNHLNENM